MEKLNISAKSPEGKGQLLKITEALRVIDDRLMEWLRRDDLTKDQQDRLMEARRAVADIESLMIIARIFDLKEIEEIIRERHEALRKLAQESSTTS